MAFGVRWLFVFLCALFASTTTAHPPWNPYDDTRFAPVRSFGPTVGVEVVADRTNLAAQGASTAPGEHELPVRRRSARNRLAGESSDPNPATNKTVFLDVTEPDRSTGRSADRTHSMNAVSSAWRSTRTTG